MKALALSVAILLSAAAARADIIEWSDADGVRHYTNMKGEVPAEHQAAAQVVVDEALRATPAGNNAPAPVTAPDPAREAQVVYDRDALAEAYVEGVQRGLAAGSPSTSAQGGGVQINGPLAVARTSTPTYPGYLAPAYYPLVTTSFDRGRSRYLTLRMLLEDQFTIDREGPYAFDQSLVRPFGTGGLSVNLNPFLPRGLPHGFPRQARVITR